MDFTKIPTQRSLLEFQSTEVGDNHEMKTWDRIYCCAQQTGDCHRLSSKHEENFSLVFSHSSLHQPVPWVFSHFQHIDKREVSRKELLFLKPWWTPPQNKRNFPDKRRYTKTSLIATQSLAICFFSYVPAHVDLFFKMHSNVDSVHLFCTWTTIQM